MTTTILCVLTVIIGISFAIFMQNIFINRKISKIPSEKDNSLALNVFKAIIFSCSGFIIAQVSSSQNVLINLLQSQQPTNFITTSMAYSGLFIFCAVLFCGFVLLTSSILYGICGKGKNVFVEVANGEISAVILFAGIFAGITFAVIQVIPLVFDLLIPYPESRVMN